VTDNDWQGIVAALKLQGPVTQLAAHCALLGKEGPRVRLQLDADGETFRRPALEERLAQALSGYFGEDIRLDITLAAEAIDTPAKQHRLAAEDRLRTAKIAIENDPNVRAMRDMFGATVQPDSVRPAD